jgi:hypothetical protein
LEYLEIEEWQKYIDMIGQCFWDGKGISYMIFLCLVIGLKRNIIPL